MAYKPMEYNDVVWSEVATQLDRALSFVDCAKDDRQTYDEGQRDQRYPYIPFHIGTFVDEMEVLRQMFGYRCAGYSNQPKLVDVGCGVGTKLLIARQFGFQCYGIELNEDLVRVARNLIYPSSNIKHADALKEDYSAYDAIYFYCPIRDPRLEAKLERQIIATAKPGTLIIGNMKCGSDPTLRSRVWTKSKVELVCAGDSGGYYSYNAFEVHRKR